jgi:hypothetical protein
MLDQFCSVFTTSTSDKQEMRKRFRHEIRTLHIDVNGVAKLLSRIKTHKSVGPDCIPNQVLKNCADELAPGLTSLYQYSIDSGKLPKDWTSANVTPIFKKGNVHLAENYRPVSLTCVASKILEHIVCKHILDHLDRNNILTKLNHGFRSGFSCESQLVTTMHDLLKNNDDNIPTDMIVLDFSKAFDTVPHDKLLYKLRKYGIEGNIHRWLSSFLCGRTMNVVTDGEKSPTATVSSGVPQGTVLGPLLFLCHINDLPEAVKSNVRLFADDCLLYRKIRSNQDTIRLQQDLDNLEVWAKSWGMKFNPTK